MQHGESPWTGEGGKVVTAGQFGNLGNGLRLEEVAASGGGLESAPDPEEGEGEVVQAVAWAGNIRRFENDSQGREEDIGEEPRPRLRRTGNAGVISGLGGI